MDKRHSRCFTVILGELDIKLCLLHMLFLAFPSYLYFERSYCPCLQVKHSIKTKLLQFDPKDKSSVIL
jgi:hypothetical protein